MQISTVLREWEAPRKAALVNSYGASGSNTSMVVLQPPKPHLASHPPLGQEGLALPFWISGTDDREINAYCARLAKYISAHPSVQLADLPVNLSRQLNRALPRQLLFSCRSISELKTMLSRGESNVSQAVHPERPVILCFGGQVSTFVGLNRPVYDSVSLLRRYLDECDSAMMAMGLESFYPDIFSTNPIEDTVKLQCMLFAMQYSCARCWMDCGVSNKIAAVIGYSFGELTALCISGVLNVQDTIKLVAGRARLIRDQWGSDKGAMMAFEGDESTVHQLLEDASKDTTSEHPASVACYNGPRSFTLAGSTAAIQGVRETTVSKYAFIRHKQLNVTNSFHFSLADGIMERLTRLGKELTFNSPAIHFEHAQSTPSTGAKPSFTFVADHLRKPVYFYHAIERLARAYPDSIWLEAGSNSTITTMTGQALRPTSDMNVTSKHHFQALNITHGHHPVHMSQYAHLVLPPRQFAKTRHGQDIIPAKSDRSAAQKADTQPSDGLWTFIEYEDNNDKRPRFRINSKSEKYLAMVEGHAMARTAAICPTGLEVDMAIEALFSLHPGWTEKRLQPMLTDMINSAPGSLHIRSPDDAIYRAEFARLERVVPHRKCTDILDMVGAALIDEEDEIRVLQGRNVLRRLVGQGNESAACVLRKRSHETWLDVPLSECFMQTGGIWVSCMTDRSPDDVFIATGCELWMRSPHLADAKKDDEGPELCHVLARHSRVSDKVYLSDVFVFDFSHWGFD
ncbi:acyl transferase/acyl hydrolase/lysophospholipase [Aspergillus undulatus]|uniref:acyl transferase/acyl hydrolase/lysophospholipase n=1 Tax=Aspergillus undulatus TaxID=1810928 RepID=UPI003CCD07F4